MFRSSTPMLSYGPMHPPSAQRLRRPKTASDRRSSCKPSAERSWTSVTSLSESMASQPPKSSRSRAHRRRQPKMNAARYIGLWPSETTLKTATRQFVRADDPFAVPLKELPKVTYTAVQGLMQPTGECDEFGLVIKRALADHYYIGTEDPTRGPRPTKKTLHMKALASLAQSEGRVSRESTMSTDSQGIPKLEGMDGPLCFARKANNVELFTQPAAKTKCVQFACFEETREDFPMPAFGTRHSTERGLRVESTLPDIAVQDSASPEGQVRPSRRGNPVDESLNPSGGGAVSRKAAVRFQSPGSQKRPTSRPESVPNPGRISSAKASGF